MPSIDDPKVGRSFIAYTDSANAPTLYLMQRWKVTKANIERLRTDQEFLELDIAGLKERLTYLRRLSRPSVPERALCHFCRCQISKLALVCNVCGRAQPHAYETIAKRDAHIAAQIQLMMPTPIALNISGKNQCVFCLSDLVLGTLLCPACLRTQPSAIGAMYAEDVAAMRAIIQARKGRGEGEVQEPPQRAPTP